MYRITLHVACLLLSFDQENQWWFFFLHMSFYWQEMMKLESPTSLCTQTLVGSFETWDLWLVIRHLSVLLSRCKHGKNGETTWSWNLEVRSLWWNTMQPTHVESINLSWAIQWRSYNVIDCGGGAPPVFRAQGHLYICTYMSRKMHARTHVCMSWIQRGEYMGRWGVTDMYK